MPPDRPLHVRSLLLLALGLTLPLVVAAVLPFHIPLPTYLTLHNLMELFAVVMAALVAAVGLATAGPAQARGVTFLAVGFLAVAAFDTFHLLSYQGMPALITPSSPSKAIWFWLAARITAAVSLLVYAARPRQIEPRLGLLAVTFTWVGAAIWVVLAGEAALPVVFVDGVGLTPFKQAVELLLCLSYLAVALLLLRSPDRATLIRHDRLAEAAVAMAVSEAAFCLYQDVTDGFNFIGHVEKIVAYALLYTAVFRGAVRDPYHRLAASVAELRASEARFRELADAIDEVFFLSDVRTGAVLYISPGAERITQQTVAELGASPDRFFPFVHPEDRERLAALSAGALTQETTTELRILRPDGNERWVVVRAGPVRDDAGNVYRIAGVARDATEEKLLQAQLATAQRMETVSRLAAGVAHDFNNLLTVILTATTFAAESARDGDASLREDIASIEAAARRAQALTRQLLTLARRDRSPTQVVDLGAVARDLLRMIEGLVGVDVAVRAEIAPGPHPVIGIPSQIEQLIVNFAVNARDAMPTGGTLRIEVSAATEGDEVQPPRVMLRVTDTGEGMPEEVRQHAFEPFFTTKGGEKGTGLGLATCYGIVRELGGEIRLESTVGVGTRVIVLLPRAAGLALPAPAARPSGAGRGEVVLVVDDEPAVRKSAARALAAQRFAPVEAGSAAEALERLAELPEVALLLTDVRMPGTGGVELARMAQAARPGLRVLFMSGYADQELPSELLAKPFTTEELGQAVRQVLDGPDTD